MEFVRGSFSCFCTEMASSNFTFCGAWSLISHEKCPNFKKTSTPPKLLALLKQCIRVGRDIENEPERCVCSVELRRKHRRFITHSSHPERQGATVRARPDVRHAGAGVIGHRRVTSVYSVRPPPHGISNLPKTLEDI